MEALESRLVNGTEGATFVFWSPDSRSLGYVAAGELRRVDVDGGASQTICEISNFAGATWLDSGSIVFSSFTGSGGRVMRVSDRGAWQSRSLGRSRDTNP